MSKTRFRLLVAAILLTVPSLLPSKAQAVCFFYCWHVDADVTCCRTRSCEIVCS